jgi:OOP family OmpA-OmpF porin
MLNKLTLGFVIGTAAASAFAQTATNIQANPKSSAYAQDNNGTITRSPFGLCWRSGYWTAADAVPGCDGELAPPVARPTAPPLVAAPSAAPQALPPAPVVAAPKRCDFSVTLESDQTFGFNKAVLTNAAKKRIDNEVIGKLDSCSKIDLVIVTGHTDRLGTQQYNQKLSDKRAAAVATYLKSKNVSAPIDTLGVGKTQSIKSCGDKLGHKKLIECLAPNRRVVIEARGAAK